MIDMEEDEKDIITTELRQFLIDYRLLQGSLKRLKLEYKRLLQGPRDIAPVNYSGLPPSRMVRNTEADMNRLVKVQEEIEDLEKDIDAIDSMFEALDAGKSGHEYSKILRGYYIEGKGIAELARELKVSKVTISTYKKQAVYNFTVMMEGKKACKSKLKG